MENDNILVGLFFHTQNDEGRLLYEGQILGLAAPDHYLCQLYSSITGEPTNRLIKHVAEMAEWAFYSTEEQWHSAAQNLLAMNK